MREKTKETTQSKTNQKKKSLHKTPRIYRQFSINEMKIDMGIGGRKENGKGHETRDVLCQKLDNKVTCGPF